MRTELVDVAARAERAAVHQSAGHRLSRRATKKLYQEVKVLREDHRKPIAQIRRATRDQMEGLDRACRLPRCGMPVGLLADDARGVRDVVRGYEQWFFDNGLNSDFLARLDSAIHSRDRRSLVTRCVWCDARNPDMVTCKTPAKGSVMHVCHAIFGTFSSLSNWR